MSFSVQSVRPAILFSLSSISVNMSDHHSFFLHHFQFNLSDHRSFLCVHHFSLTCLTINHFSASFLGVEGRGALNLSDYHSFVCINYQAWQRGDGRRDPPALCPGTGALWPAAQPTCDVHFPLRSAGPPLDSVPASASTAPASQGEKGTTVLKYSSVSPFPENCH